MDKLSPIEEFKSGMMLQTATDVFVESVGPAVSFVKTNLKNEPREKQCAACHVKAVEGFIGEHHDSYRMQHKKSTFFE